MKNKRIMWDDLYGYCIVRDKTEFEYVASFQRKDHDKLKKYLFLKNIKIPSYVDGEAIDISNKLYKEIKNIFELRYLRYT
jgi:hypothetical protein